MRRADFLVELLTEELPPKALLRLASSFLAEMTLRLQKAGLQFQPGEYFATPRRLAVRFAKLSDRQQDNHVERRGPALKAAFGAAGQPTPACIGFARSCGVTPAELTVIREKQREWVGFREMVPGKTVEELLPAIITEALAALPVPKRMRWGDGTESFVRPVHSLVVLYGRNVIDMTLFGCQSGHQTAGHRFYTTKPVQIAAPSVYEKTLEKNFVIADFERRRALIRTGIALAAKDAGGMIQPDENLLEEVTGLVEWPVAISGCFDKKFLQMPPEIPVSAMRDHQRYFTVVDKKGRLLPRFVTVLNMESRNPRQVIAGNERVLRARLSDAAFFFENDKKITLAARCEKGGPLEHTVFHAKLGTLADRSRRIEAIAAFIAKKSGSDVSVAKRAGFLAFADLATEVVGEFPQLQGIMGKYYALADREKPEVADALAEQYLPRFAGDSLPASAAGCALALAARLDLLVGIFGVREMPSGDRDPYGLRRAALGVVRILAEKKIDLDLAELLKVACVQFGEKFAADKVVTEVQSFINERMKYWYLEQGVPADVFAAVAALEVTRPHDFHLRVQAVREFVKLPEATSLSIANKRVSNILAKAAKEVAGKHEIDARLFELPAEKNLATLLGKKKDVIATCSRNSNYTRALAELAALRGPVDDFFASVLVMAEDDARRRNRLQMLVQLRALFLHVADIACLQ